MRTVNQLRMQVSHKGVCTYLPIQQTHTTDVIFYTDFQSKRRCPVPTKTKQLSKKISIVTWRTCCHWRSCAEELPCSAKEWVAIWSAMLCTAMMLDPSWSAFHRLSIQKVTKRLIICRGLVHDKDTGICDTHNYDHHQAHTAGITTQCKSHRRTLLTLQFSNHKP